MAQVLVLLDKNSYMEYALEDETGACCEIANKEGKLLFYVRKGKAFWKLEPVNVGEIEPDLLETRKEILLSKEGVWEYRDEEGQTYALLLMDRDTKRAFQIYEAKSKITIGAASENTIVYAFQGLVSKQHCICRWDGEQWKIEDTSTNGIFIERQRVEENGICSYGEKLCIYGLHILFLGKYIAVQGTRNHELSVRLSTYEETTVAEKTEGAENGICQITPISRPVFAWEKKKFHLDADEEGREMEPSVFLKFGTLELSFQRKKKKREREQQLLERNKSLLEAEWEKRRTALREAYPSAKERIQLMLQGKEIWLQREESDSLWLRTGLGKRDSYLEVVVSSEHATMQEQLQKQYGVVTEVPIGVTLQKEQAVGIVCEKNNFSDYELIRCILVQLLLEVNPQQVGLVLIYDGSNPIERNLFRALRFAPQMQQEHGIRRIYESREEVDEATPVWKKETNIPQYIICTKPEWLLEGEQSFDWMEMCRCGYTGIFIGDRFEKLSHFCGQVFEKEKNSYVEQLGRKIEFQCDQVSEEEWDCFAQKLSTLCLRDEKQRVEFPEILAFDVVEKKVKTSVLEEWEQNTCETGIRAAIGSKRNGQPFYLDLHEKKQGPHGLLLGMTGAGKSQLLQTILLSYGLAYSPKELQFLLIDYKGGSMAEELQRLPQVAGVLTNFDQDSGMRGLEAIFSENRRRQELLAAKKVSHIDEYNRCVQENGLSHLCIIVDEFAELQRKNPKFMEGLLQVARTGRSLGIHLLLATQKAGGVVDESILANCNVRICMRMQDQGESFEILHTKVDCSLLPVGRAYTQSGQDEAEEIQIAYAGAIYKDEVEEHCQWVSVNGTPKETEVVKKVENKREQTQLSYYVEEIVRQAKEKNIAWAEKLWLPELAKEIALDECISKADGKTGITLGMCDNPSMQEQFALQFFLENEIAMLITGPANSGKSTAIHTMLLQVLQQNLAWIYLFAFGKNEYEGYEKFPQVGGIVTSEEQAEKYLSLLEQELRERQEETSDKNRVPILLFIDSLADFRRRTRDRYQDRIYRILRDGAGCGMHCVMTAAGFGLKEVPFTWKRQFSKKIALCPDEESSLALFDTCELPDGLEHLAGRGMVEEEGSFYLVQLAMPWEEDSLAGKQREIEHLTEQLAIQNCVKAKQIYTFSDLFLLSEFLESEDVRLHIQEKTEIPFARKEMDGNIVDFSEMQSLLLAGKSREQREKICDSLCSIIQYRGGACVVLGGKKKLESDLQFVCETPQEVLEGLDFAREQADEKSVWIVVKESRWLQEECGVTEQEEIGVHISSLLKENKYHWIFSCSDRDYRFMRPFESIREKAENSDKLFMGMGAQEQQGFPADAYSALWEEHVKMENGALFLPAQSRSPIPVRIPLCKEEE